jgi:hypothetical protein
MSANDLDAGFLDVVARIADFVSYVQHKNPAASWDQVQEICVQRCKTATDVKMVRAFFKAVIAHGTGSKVDYINPDYQGAAVTKQ